MLTGGFLLSVELWAAVGFGFGAYIDPIIEVGPLEDRCVLLGAGGAAALLGLRQRLPFAELICGAFTFCAASLAVSFSLLALSGFVILMLQSERAKSRWSRRAGGNTFRPGSSVSGTRAPAVETVLEMMLVCR